MNESERVMKMIIEWDTATYDNETQCLAVLQIAIRDMLADQRRACAEGCMNAKGKV